TRRRTLWRTSTGEARRPRPEQYAAIWGLRENYAYSRFANCGTLGTRDQACSPVRRQWKIGRELVREPSAPLLRKHQLAWRLFQTSRDDLSGAKGRHCDQLRT